MGLFPIMPSSRDLPDVTAFLNWSLYQREHRKERGADEKTGSA